MERGIGVRAASGLRLSPQTQPVRQTRIGERGTALPRCQAPGQRLSWTETKRERKKERKEGKMLCLPYLYLEAPPVQIQQADHQTLQRSSDPPTRLPFTQQVYLIPIRFLHQSNF